MLDEHGYWFDEEKDRVIKFLYTGNKHLDGLTKVYFAHKIKEPILGDDCFKYVEHHFDYALREYSITHSFKIEPMQSPTQSELLVLNDIPKELFETYKKNVDEILQSYTDINWSKDKQHKVLIKQLKKLADGYQDKESSEFKMHQKLIGIDPSDSRTSRFLNDILKEMKKASVNQTLDDRYIVVDKLIDLYLDMKKYFDIYNFKEKKKYLKKLDMEKATAKLHGYIKEMLEDDYIRDFEELLDNNYSDDEYFKMQHETRDHNGKLIYKVRWFLFYLIYDAKKIDIFLVHSVLGYKYDGAVKLYKKIFLKDHTTASNDNFLHHTDILNISESEVYDRKHEAQFNKILEDISKSKGLSGTALKHDSTYNFALQNKMFAYNSYYEHIIRTMKDGF